MNRVLIVDDEFEIREGLSAVFPWRQYGVDEVLTAEDGFSALAKAREYNPELIITDIKMNRMSGLEFLERLNEGGRIRSKAIVISGYDDFDLVRQAMYLGAIDYVLKPLDTEELAKTVMRAIEQIRLEQQEEWNKQKLEQQIQYARPKMQEDLLRELTEHPYDSSYNMRVRHRLQTVQLEWIFEEKLSLQIIEADNLKAIGQSLASRREKELVLFGIGNVVKECWESGYIRPFHLFMDEKRRWVLIYSCESDEEWELSKEIAGNCIRQINQYVKVHASIGICTVIGDMKQLFRLYQKTRENLELKAVYGGNRVLADLKMEAEDEVSAMSLLNHDEMLDLIRYGTADDIHQVFQTFDEMVRAWSTTHIRDTQQRLFEWLLELYKKASVTGYTNKQWKKNPLVIWEQLEQYDTLESLQIQTEKLVLKISGEVSELTAPQSHIISEAIKYVSAHYMDNLTLQSVAKEVHVTPVWLSKLFRKEQNRTFLEYLTDVRMNKAKELLGDVRYKIYQVAQEVGYRDPVYFSKAFRKYAGVTPKEYRNLKGIHND